MSAMQVLVCIQAQIRLCNFMYIHFFYLEERANFNKNHYKAQPFFGFIKTDFRFSISINTKHYNIQQISEAQIFCRKDDRKQKSSFDCRLSDWT